MKSPIEYRIGNLQIDRNGIICEVYELTKDSVKVAAINGCITALPTRDIPITIDLLKSANFNRRFENDDCNLYDYTPEMQKEWKNRGQGFFCIADFTDKHGFFLDIQSRVTLKYIHELQNIFFEITGQELKFNL